MTLRRSDLLVALALALAAALPRIDRAEEQSAFLDELLWLGEGRRTIERLPDGPVSPAAWGKDLRHPGVLVAIAGGLAEATRTRDEGAIEGDVRVLGLARRLIALAGILTVVALYLLGVPSLGRTRALCAAMALAASPFHIANSPWLQCDALLTLWTTVALLAAAAYLNRPNRGWLLLCAVGTAQAIVAKMSGLFLLPVLLGALVLWPGRGGIRALVDPWHLAFGPLVLLLVYASWPRIWLDPWEAIRVVEWGRHVADKGHPNFFMGTITRDPPWTYYLAVVPIRLSEALELVGLASALALAAVDLVRRRGAQHPAGCRPHRSILLVSAFAVLYVVFMSMQSKKLGARYVLPIWPWIALVVGTVVARAVERLPSRRAAWLVLGGYSMLLVSTAVWTFAPIYPSRLAAYTRAFGGLGRGARVELAGYGLIEKDIAAALEALPRGSRVAVAAHPASVSWHTRRRFSILDDRTLARRLDQGAYDYAIVARYEEQRRPALRAIGEAARVVRRLRLGGVELATVYRFDR